MTSPATCAKKNSVETKIPFKFVPTPFPYHFQLKVRVDSLSDMGTGEGYIEDDSDELPTHPEGWRVRVPLVLPGELVTVRVFKNMDDFSAGMKEHFLI
jgi:hypothetical protein